MNRDYVLLAKKLAIMFCGFFLMSAGGVLGMESGLGVGPWNMLHIGIANHTPVTAGQASQGVGLLLIVLSYFLGIKPAFGTVAGMISFGVFFDLIHKSGVIPTDPGLVPGLVFVVLGVVCYGMGCGLYINTSMGTGPRDSLMLGFKNKLGWRIRRVRTIIETTVFIIGFLLGGPVGIGTVIFALSIGQMVEWSLRYLNFFPKEEEKQEGSPFVAR